jgi:CheY-like chemotaxis protein
MSRRRDPNGGTDELDNLLRALQGHRDQSRLEAAYGTGALIVQALYDGHIDRWRHRARRDSLYAKLENHPSLPFGSAELYRSLRIFELGVRHPDLIATEFLTLSHFLAVMSLDMADQARFLTAACQFKWTVRQLRHAVSQAPASGSWTGRPRTPPVLKTLRPLAAENAFEGVDDLIALDRNTATDVLNICRRAREMLERVESVLLTSSIAAQTARILVVDSNQAFTARARRELRKHVRSVRLAHSFAQALLQADEHVACAAINVQLDDGSGVELSNQLLSSFPSLQVVFLTSVRPHLLPVEAKAAHPIIPKTSGLRPLTVAILAALNSSAALATASVLSG